MVDTYNIRFDALVPPLDFRLTRHVHAQPVPFALLLYQVDKNSHQAIRVLWANRRDGVLK